MSMSRSMQRVVGALPVLGAMAMLTVLAGCAADKPVAGYGLPPAESTRAAGLLPPPPETAAPDNEAMYRSLIERMQAQGLFFASLAHIAKFEQQFGTNPDTQLMRARALRETGQLADAAALYRQVLGSPQKAAGWQGLGLIAGAQGRFAESAQALAQAAQRAPTDARILNDYGYALMRSGRLPDARVPLAQAAELEQTNPQIVANLAVYLRASGETDRANAVMDRAQLAPVTRAAIIKLADSIRIEAPVAAAQGVGGQTDLDEPRAASAPPAPGSQAVRPVVSRIETAAAPVASVQSVRSPVPPVIASARSVPAESRVSGARIALPMHSMFERFGTATP